jgi:hypothetical protein
MWTAFSNTACVAGAGGGIDKLKTTTDK